MVLFHGVRLSDQNKIKNRAGRLLSNLYTGYDFRMGECQET